MTGTQHAFGASALPAASLEMLSMVTDGLVSDTLEMAIEAMAEVYAKLQAAGRSERERLALELTKLSQSKQVTQAYTSLG